MIVKHILLSLCVGVCSQQAIASNITIGAYSYKPEVRFVKGDDGKLMAQGQSVDLLRKVILKSGSEVRFVKLPLTRALKALKNNKVDFLFPVIDPPSSVKIVSQPVVKTIPDLCFKPEKFVAILSAQQQLKGMMIAYEAGTSIAPLKDGPVRLREVYGSDIRDRMFSMLEKDRVTAFYHSNPRIIYQENLPTYQKVACSYYYGYTSNIYLGASDKFFEEHNEQFFQIQQQLKLEIKALRNTKKS